MRAGMRQREIVLNLKPKFNKPKPLPKKESLPKVDPKDLQITEVLEDLEVIEVAEPKKESESKKFNEKVEDLGCTVESIYIHEVNEESKPKKKIRKKRKS